MDSTFFTGLPRLGELFVSLPPDIVKFGVMSYILLAVLAIRRLFW